MSKREVSQKVGYELTDDEIEELEKYKPQTKSWSGWMKLMAFSGIKYEIGEIEDRKAFEKRILKIVDAKIDDQIKINRSIDYKVKKIEDNVITISSSVSELKEEIVNSIGNLKEYLVNATTKAISSQLEQLIQDSVTNSIGINKDIINNEEPKIDIQKVKVPELSPESLNEIILNNPELSKMVKMMPKIESLLELIYKLYSDGFFVNAVRENDILKIKKEE